MKIISILIFVILISGCAGGAMPNFYNGKYYLAGDSNCRFMRQLEANRIMCQDASRKDVGYRDAMTDQQLQMYMHQQSMDQANSAMYLQYMQQNMQQNEPVNLKTNCTSNVINGTVYTNCR
jgi:hypothetical protein